MYKRQAERCTRSPSCAALVARRSAGITKLSAALGARASTVVVIGAAGRRAFASSDAAGSASSMRSASGRICEPCEANAGSASVRSTKPRPGSGASADGAPSSELVFVERGDALLWLSRKALGGEVKSNESLATLRTHGTLIGCTEVLLAIPRPFDARMLTDGEIVRLSLDELLQIRADRPDVWEALLLKSMQGQNTTASEALFSVEG